MKIAVKERKEKTYNFLTIFSDLQTTIFRILNDELSSVQVLTIEIIKIVQNLSKKGIQIFIRWVLSHTKIEKNERTDSLVKKVTKLLKNI